MNKIATRLLLACCLAGIKVCAQPPAPGYTGTTTICTGNGTTITATGQAGATFRWWDAATGGTLKSSSAAYNVPTQGTAGAYHWYVEQTVGGLTGPRTDVTVTVNQTPTVAITPANPAVCLGSSALLTASGASTYTWSPGGASGNTLNVSPSTNTVYTATGTLNGCSATGSTTVSVNRTTASSDVTICPGYTTTLSASGAGTYVWNPGNLSGASVNVSPTVTTTYIVSGTGSGCTTTDTVVVTARPVVGLAAGGNVTVPEGTAVNLTCSSALTATYVWTPNHGNAGTLSGNSVYVVPTQSATYTVTSTDGFGCNATATTTVTLSKLAAVTGNTTICSGTATTLTASGTGPYAWYDAASNGNLLSSNAAYNTGNLTTDRSYWVSANGGERKEVKVSVAATQAMGVTATPAAICGGMTSSLKATYLGLIKWYDAPAGGNLVGTTTSDTSLPVRPAATTTYYAEGVPVQFNLSFSYTGAVQTWTVPPGVTSINIDAYGSAGEMNAGKQYNGKGGRVQAVMNVTPGQVLNIYVGGKDNFNGGGARVISSGAWTGTRGGDATDIRIGGTALTDRVLVAGGGAGSGWNIGTNQSANQGHGGGLNGQSGGYQNVGDGVATAGGGGTQSNGGSRGVMNGQTNSINPGIAGAFGQGGRSGAYSGQYSGGAGGGGWYGGGGGTSSGDGGGGSSYTNPIICQNVIHTQGAWDDVGVLFISYGISCGATTRVPVTVTVKQAFTPVVSDTLAGGCAGSAVNLYATGLAPANEVASFNGTQALGTNGNGGQANIPAVANSFTMDFWVKPGSTLTQVTPATNGIAGTTGQRYAIMPYQSGANAGAGVSVGTNGIYVFEHGNGYLPALLAYNATIPDTTFTHVAVVYTNKQPSLYVNGYLATTGLASTMPNVYPSIGSDGAGGYGPFIGQLDNVRIWNGSLSASEVLSVMGKANATVPGKTLVARYSFDAGSSVDDKGTPTQAQWSPISSAPLQTYYTYAWAGTGAVPAASGNNKQTTTAAQGTTRYWLSTQQNGCVTLSDTIDATTDAVPAGTISGGIALCQNASAPLLTFTGSGGTAPYTFSYNINGGSTQTITTPANAPVRYIRVKQNGTVAGSYLHLAELRAIQVGTNTNVALGKGGVANSTSPGFPISNLTDNNVGTYWHSNGTGVNEYVQIDLGAGYLLDHIELVNRVDCCWDRATNLQLILNDSNNVLYTSTAINAYQNQNNGYTSSWPVAAPSKVTLPVSAGIAGNFQYSLVKVMGGGCETTSSSNTTVTISPYATISTEPVATSTVCTSNPVVLRVTAANATGYQWRKGGANIPSATAAIYSKSNSVAGDAGTYSVIALGANGCNDTSANSVVGISTMSSSLAPANTTVSNVQADGLSYSYTDASCRPFANITDATGGNVLGNVTASLVMDGSVQAFRGQPYLQRHYDLQPASNGAATVTLYALQSEFDAYNNYITNNVPTWPKLPTGPSDNAGKTNISVTQYHGTPASGTNGPGGQYNAGQSELIPNSAITTSWNGTYWTLSFPVSGFSGFFITTGSNTPLAIDLKDIRARNTGEQNEVSWTTATEDAGDYFEIERSLDAQHFTRIGTVRGKAATGAGYVFNDVQPGPGTNYYRLNMTGANGQHSYSKVVSAVAKPGGFTVEAYPNPAKEIVTVRVYGAVSSAATISILDVSGKLLRKVVVSGTETRVSLADLSAGYYLFHYQDEGAGRSQSFRVNKQ